MLKCQELLNFIIYEHDKFHAQLSWVLKSFITFVSDQADRQPCYRIVFVAFCDVFVSNSMATESISAVNLFTGKLYMVLLDFSLTVKAATHECVIWTG